VTQVSDDPLWTSLDHLAPDEPLSPELVLVLPPALRAQAIARLGPQTWPKPSPRFPDRLPELARGEIPVPVEESVVRAVGALAAARVVQLALIFAAVTIFTLAMSVVAQAVVAR